MKLKELKGVYPALITPFKKNGEIDEAGFRRNIDFVIEGGVAGIVPCGCTGEAATLRFEEQKRLLNIAVDQADRNRRKVPVIGGSGSNNTQEALELTQYAKDSGAAGAMLITPYYNKPMPAGQFAHYRKIAAAVEMPIILYNVPGRTGTNMLPETIAELAKDEWVVGVKEASGNMEQVEKVIELTRGGKKPFTVLSGDDNLTLPIMAMGGKGVVSVLANIMPREMCSMVKYYDEGNHNKAIDMYYKIAPIMKGMFIETNPIPVKAAANLLGIAAGPLRLPLTEMSAENQKKLKGMMDAYGVKTVRKTPKAAPIKASVKKARK